MQVPLLRKTRRCPRCDLRYPATEPRCTHCAEISEDELFRLRLEGGSQREAYRRLALIMLGLAVLAGFALGSAWILGY